MSLYGALRSGVSSLFANSQRMAMISDNIANVNTVGYKRVDARFSSFVTQSSRRGLYNSGGVVSQTERENSQQGILEPTSFATDIAVTGAGFFVVTDSVERNQDGKYINSGNVSFTRAGQFRRDSNGNLVNAEEQYLLSWAPDTTNVNRDDQARFVQTNDISQFEVVNIEQQALDPIQTSRVDVGVNLAAEAGPGFGNSFSTEVPLVDPQGISRSLILTFVKPTATATLLFPTLGSCMLPLAMRQRSHRYFLETLPPLPFAPTPCRPPTDASSWERSPSMQTEDWKTSSTALLPPLISSAAPM